MDPPSAYTSYSLAWPSYLYVGSCRGGARCWRRDERSRQGVRQRPLQLCEPRKHGEGVEELLSAVTRLLILADMIDVQLLKKLRRVEDDLEYLKSVSSKAELMDGMSRSGTLSPCL